MVFFIEVVFWAGLIVLIHFQGLMTKTWCNQDTVRVQNINNSFLYWKVCAFPFVNCPIYFIEYWCIFYSQHRVIKHTQVKVHGPVRPRYGPVGGRCSMTIFPQFTNVTSLICAVMIKWRHNHVTWACAYSSPWPAFPVSLWLWKSRSKSETYSARSGRPHWSNRLDKTFAYK